MNINSNTTIEKSPKQQEATRNQAIIIITNMNTTSNVQRRSCTSRHRSNASSAMFMASSAETSHPSQSIMATKHMASDGSDLIVSIGRLFVQSHELLVVISFGLQRSYKTGHHHHHHHHHNWLNLHPSKKTQQLTAPPISYFATPAQFAEPLSPGFTMKIRHQNTSKNTPFQTTGKDHFGWWV